MNARLENRLPSIGAVHLLLAPALIFIAACLDRQYQTDFWHHLARGQQIVSRGRILDVDVFSFTSSGQPLRDANWLTQVVYWRLWSWGGLNLVQVVNAGLLAITLLVLVRLCRRVQRSSRAAGITGAAVFLGICPFALIRPQTGSFLLFVLLLSVLMKEGRSQWLAAPIMALWVNVHGGFAIGLLLIGAFWLARLTQFTRSRLLLEATGQEKTAASSALISTSLLLLVSIIATGLNPYGWSIYVYATTLTARAAGRGIEEWLPPSLSSAGGRVLLLWIAGLAAGAWLGRRRPTGLQLCLLACFVPPACRSVRLVPWVLLATAPMMAEFWGALAQPVSRNPQRSAGSADQNALPSATRPNRGAGRSSFSPAILLMILVGGVVMSLPWLASVNPLFGRVRSDHRMEDDLQNVKFAMAKRGPGRVFARLEWGDYLAYASQGEHPVFCDGRIELYADSIWQDYLRISAGRGDFQEVLDRWAVDYLVLDAQYHATLLTQIGRNGSWKTVWRSGQVELLTRTVPLVARKRAYELSPQAISDIR